jgi:type I restriction enzyme S subunit
VSVNCWQSYPAYKDSGVEWLGEIPEHWGVIRLKHALSRNDGGVWGEDPGSDGNEIIVLRSTDMTVDGKWNIVDPARRKLSRSEYRSAHLQTGDLVVTKSSGSALHLGKTALVTPEVEAMDCCFSNFMQRLRPQNDFGSNYLYRIFNSPIGREQLNYFGSTTTGLANLNEGVIGSLYIPAPNPEEQRAIAAFLDRETAKLDALVAKQERLIALFQERRAVLINHAVTKGLDPDVPMRDLAGGDTGALGSKAFKVYNF